MSFIRKLIADIFFPRQCIRVFQVGDDKYGAAPLVMTQSLSRSYQECSLCERYDILLTRADHERLRSAWKKKVLGGKYEIGKVLLRYCHGFRFGMTYSEMLEVLILLKNSNSFIDRHFVPIKGLKNFVVDSQEVNYISFAREHGLEKIRSSGTVSSKNNITDNDEWLEKVYLELWT